MEKLSKKCGVQGILLLLYSESGRGPGAVKL